MERRLVLAGLAALAATPALAQTSPAPPTDAPAAPAPVPAVPDAAPAPAPAMKQATSLSLSDASKTHTERTMAVGSMSLATSRIAAKKVRTPALKQFTTFEIAEQETIASILKAMAAPGAPPSGTVAAPTDAELQIAMDDKGKAVVARMEAMKAGPAFERDYVKAQIDGHRQLLDIQDAYLKAPDNLDETNVAKLAKGMILEHLALLDDLRKKIG